MRVKILGLWAWMLILVTALFIIGLKIKDAHAERADAPRCINKGAFDQTMGKRHPFMVTLPPTLSRDFIVGWNQVVTAFQVPVTTESVSLYDNPVSPSY